MASKTRPCPICRKPAQAKSEFFPFCSARCKTIDLGDWAAERYVISRPLNESDEHLSQAPGEDRAADDQS